MYKRQVYLSLGVNELGYYDDQGFYDAYCKAIDDIRACQPNAVIYIQGLIPLNEDVIAQSGGPSYLTNEHLPVSYTHLGAVPKRSEQGLGGTQQAVPRRIGDVWMMKLAPQVNTALELLEAAGYEAYLVGGAVRDFVRDSSPAKDWDIATNALPEQVKAVFAGFRLIETGLKHGTVRCV